MRRSVCTALVLTLVAAPAWADTTIVVGPGGWGGLGPLPPEQYRFHCPGESPLNLVLIPDRGVGYTTLDRYPELGPTTWRLATNPATYHLSLGPTWISLDRTSLRLAVSTARPGSPAVTCRPAPTN